MEDWREFLGIAEKSAREAGKLLKKGIGEGKKIYFKGTVDLVTDFDKKAQEIIFKRLSDAFPSHGFLAEEELRKRPEKDYLWIIDPLDGTTNYAHRFPIFCVSIALQFQERIVLGVVYDPMREEMFAALTGQGAMLNGKRIRVSSVDDLNRSLLATGFPYDIRESPVNNVDHFNDFIIRAQAVRRCGSAALDLCYVACGRFDGFWELKLKPWDVAAGALLVQEAGGRLSDFDGKDFSVEGAELMATNGLIHEAMMRILQMGKARRLARQGGEES